MKQVRALAIATVDFQLLINLMLQIAVPREAAIVTVRTPNLLPTWLPNPLAKLQ
jgi:hypothetical protein